MTTMEARYQEHPQSVEGGEHHEKKPMLSKMKDKMKKIKNNFSEKVHGHNADGGHEPEHDNDGMSEEEEVYEEAEEEKEAKPEVNAAPERESEAARNSAGAGGRDENLGPRKVAFGEATAATAVEDPSGTKENRLNGTTAASDERNSVRDRDENIDPQKVALGAKAGSVEEDHSALKAKTGTQAAAATQLSHPSNPSSTGGDEVGESPLLSSAFQAMAVSDKPKDAEGVRESPPVGTHDQFSPDKPQQDAPKEGTEEQKSSSYTDKISSTATPLPSSFQATEISDKPGGAEGVLESPPIGTHDQFSPDKPQQDTPKEGTEEQKNSSYPDKISSTATPLPSSFQEKAVSDKPEGAEGVLESPPIRTDDEFSPDKPQQDAPKEGTEEQKSSSYTEKISSTATTAKDTAVSAAIGSAEYGRKIASTVYGKVSEAGTAIMGKGTTQEEKNDIKTGQPGQPENGVSDKAKGVSMKEYVVGILRPADEDRALSEVITDAGHTKKQEASGGTPQGAKGSSQESGPGKGMVEKIKGAVTSLIGAGSTAGAARGPPTTTAATDTVAE